MNYGTVEFTYAEPFANALASDASFRAWVLACTKFERYSQDARILNEEMASRRSGLSQTWWRSHYTAKCRCPGCSGQETDILAIFEAANGARFSLHFEVKHPTDKFPAKKDQAGNYALRAQCWVGSPPQAVLPHSDSSTVLLCSSAKLHEFEPHILKFGSVITFEEVQERFPHATRSA